MPKNVCVSKQKQTEFFVQHDPHSSPPESKNMTIDMQFLLHLHSNKRKINYFDDTHENAV